MLIEFIQEYGNFHVGDRKALHEAEGNPFINLGVAQVITEITSGGHPQGKPDYFDVTTSTTVVYEGFKSGETVILCKTDLTAGTRTWGTDSWANRVTATYA